MECITINKAIEMRNIRILTTLWVEWDDFAARVKLLDFDLLLRMRNHASYEIPDPLEW